VKSAGMTCLFGSEDNLDPGKMSVILSFIAARDWEGWTAPHYNSLANPEHDPQEDHFEYSPYTCGTPARFEDKAMEIGPFVTRGTVTTMKLDSCFPSFVSTGRANSGRRVEVNRCDVDSQGFNSVARLRRKLTRRLCKCV